MLSPRRLLALAAVFAAAPLCQAQYTMDWFTVDGGGSLGLSGGVFDLSGTSGQPDAGTMVGGAYEFNGGFWFGVLGSATCYANCDGSTTIPLLTINDFVCFQTRFAAGDSYANCDGSTGAPILTVND